MVAERIEFLKDWITDLSKSSKFEDRNQVFQLKQELKSREMFQQSIDRDNVIKQMENDLVPLVKTINARKLDKRQKQQYQNLKQRVLQNKYVQIKDKAADYELAQMLSQIV